MFPCAGQNRETDLSIFNKLNLSLDKWFVANTIIGVVAWILNFVLNSKPNLTFMLVWSTNGFFCLMVAYDYSLFRWIFESGNLASWSCICEAEYRCCENGNVPVAGQVSDMTLSLWLQYVPCELEMWASQAKEKRNHWVQIDRLNWTHFGVQFLPGADLLLHPLPSNHHWITKNHKAQKKRRCIHGK